MIEVCQRRADRRRASTATLGILVVGLLVGTAVTGASASRGSSRVSGLSPSLRCRGC